MGLLNEGTWSQVMVQPSVSPVLQHHESTLLTETAIQTYTFIPEQYTVKAQRPLFFMRLGEGRP